MRLPLPALTQIQVIYKNEMFFPISLYKVSVVKTCQLLEEWENLEEQVEIGFNSAFDWFTKCARFLDLLLPGKLMQN